MIDCWKTVREVALSRLHDVLMRLVPGDLLGSTVSLLQQLPHIIIFLGNPWNLHLPSTTAAPRYGNQRRSEKQDSLDFSLMGRYHQGDAGSRVHGADSSLSCAG